MRVHDRRRRSGRRDPANQRERLALSEKPTVHLLWINAGLSCDGDSVALTAATQPSIEEIVLGALPGLPKRRGALAADRLRHRAAVHRLVLEGHPRREQD